MRKPVSLLYGVEDIPPRVITIFNGIQHVALIAINLVYPILIFRAADAPIPVISDLLSMGLLVLATGTFLQAYRMGPVGSGYMCPSTFTATYFAPSMLAVKAGGLPLMFGMTIFAGLLETLLSPLLNRLRSFFPPEISGLVIFMIGLSAGITGVRVLVAPGAAPVSAQEWWVCGITLVTMVALNVWGIGIARMLCTLIGLIVGYFVSAFFGLFNPQLMSTFDNAQWLGVPSYPALGWSFDPALALPFAIAAVAVAMKATGTITVCQRMNDADWVRPDMRTITGGVLADGLSTVVAGVAGATGTNTSTPSVGLAAATGVGSRQVAYAAAALFLILAFLPKLTALLAIMPRPVIVASLLFSVTFIIINGVQVMTSRLMDARRTLVLGLSIVAGTAIEVFPSIAASAPAALAPLVGSSLVFATLIALGLNLLFRIGVRRTVTLRIRVRDLDPQAIEDFFASQTAAWGARPDVAKRASFSIIQLVEAVAETCWQSGEMTISATFDEFNLDVRLAYQGTPLPFPEQRPSVDDIRDREDGAQLLAGFMLRRNADRIRSEARNGVALVHFHFDH